MGAKPTWPRQTPITSAAPRATPGNRHAWRHAALEPNDRRQPKASLCEIMQTGQHEDSVHFMHRLPLLRTRTVKSIFISYRQDDAKPWALMLRDDLVGAFGEDRVFLDKDTLHAGNWRAQLQSALKRSKVVLVIMGPRWLTVAEKRGERRLDSPDDVHRQEIALALATEGLTVIPVRVDGAPMPRPEELGDDIRDLANQQSREISDVSAHRALDLQFLIGDIERATGLTARQSTPVPVRSKARLFIAATILSVIVVVVAQLTWRTAPDAAEMSLLVLLALLVVLGGAWVKGRFTRRDQ